MLDKIKFGLDSFGYLSTSIVILSSAVAFFLWAKGILPILFRLGRGLAITKIAIFSDSQNLTSLRKLLQDTNLFSNRNIIGITTKGDFGGAEDASLYLIYWPDWRNDLEDILDKANDKTAIIIYAPRELGLIPEPKMAKINEKRNIMITNFRGRLLSDIIVSMITRSCSR